LRFRRLDPSRIGGTAPFLPGHPRPLKILPREEGRLGPTPTEGMRGPPPIPSRSVRVLPELYATLKKSGMVHRVGASLFFALGGYR